MKISKMVKNKWIKWIIIVVACYLLASFGVNSIVNPLRYIDTGTKTELSYAVEGDYLVIDLAKVAEQEGYINISVKEMDVFQVTAEIIRNYNGKQSDSEKLRINEVVNSYKISSLGEGLENIAISQADLESAGVVFDEVFWSEARQVNAGKMIMVFVSFMCLVIFRECMQYIKVKYSK